MSTRIDRMELLQRLEAIQPGLSPRDIVEQSSCFVFKDGLIQTYNDEIACRIKSPFKFTGAVTAAPLLAILNKLKEDDVEVEPTEEELLIIGKKRRAGIRMDAEITLPIDSVEKPKKWRPIHEDFVEAISIVHECAGTNQEEFALTCVHIHPKYIEACDNHQLTRYRISSGVTVAALVRRDAIKHIISLDMTEFAETETWIHFRNPTGLMLSCRRFIEEFPNLSPILKVEGEPTTLPKGLADAADKAEVFSKENADDNQVMVELRPGKLRIKGTGTSGWYSEVKKLKYNGKAISFQISPRLLMELTKRHNECLVSEERLKVDGGKWVYVSCLGKVEEKDNGE